MMQAPFQRSGLRIGSIASRATTNEWSEARGGANNFVVTPRQSFDARLHGFAAMGPCVRVILKRQMDTRAEVGGSGIRRRRR